MGPHSSYLAFVSSQNVSKSEPKFHSSKSVGTPADQNTHWAEYEQKLRAANFPLIAFHLDQS